MVSALKVQNSSRNQKVTFTQRQWYSQRVKLYEDEESAAESWNEQKREALIKEVVQQEEDLSLSKESSVWQLDSDHSDWEDWAPALRGWLSALHSSPMTMETAKLVWSDYKIHVGPHPEITRFLTLMFQQLSPYIFFDHLETLYSDIVVTGNLTTAIGRDMVKFYLQRNDLQNAETVVGDLTQAGLDVSGSTMAMLIRLHGKHGNLNQMWSYFDTQCNTRAFREQPFPYLLGSLFTALGELQTNHEADVLSLFQIMISGGEYHPNGPEYYRWLESQGASSDATKALEGQTDEISSKSSSNLEMPDLPLIDPVRLPAPDGFCFCGALSAMRTVEGAKTIWGYCEQLRRITPRTWSSYILCLANIDLPTAVEEFRVYVKTGYSQKGNNFTASLFGELVSKSVALNDLDSLNLLLEATTKTRRVTVSDATAVTTLLLRRGATPEEIYSQMPEILERCGLKPNALMHALRNVILEYLKLEKPQEATQVLDMMLAEHKDALYYHHWTPIPIWYLHKLIHASEQKKLAANHSDTDTNSASAKTAEEIQQLDTAFRAFHERVMSSTIGPSTFYIRTVAMLHPDTTFALEQIDRAISGDHMQPSKIIANIIHSEAPFERARALVSHCHKKYNVRVEPVIAQYLIECAAKEKDYKGALSVARELIDAVVNSFKLEPNDPNRFQLKGSWVFFFTSTVLKPLGIITPLHAHYRYHKYDILNETEAQYLSTCLNRWIDNFRKFGPRETAIPTSTYHRARTPKIPSRSQQQKSNKFANPL